MSTNQIGISPVRANAIATAIETGEFHAGCVCVDCKFYVAYGTTPDEHYPGDRDQWDQNTVDATLRKFLVLLSAVHTGPYAHNCSHEGYDCPDDCDCDTSDFSTDQCSVCGTDLVGARDLATLISYRWMNAYDANQRRQDR